MARPATRNIGRLSEIAQVAVKHGFGYFFERHRLTDLVPWIGRDGSVETPTDRGRRLREMLDELGPTFVKFGQLLSTRPDIVPPDVLRDLQKLQDDVRPIPFADVERVISEELGITIEQAFLEFDEQPTAAASIGQVHHAVLPNGERVAVKVQRPNAPRQIESDIALLYQAARLAKERVRALDFIDAEQVVDEFARSIRGELDYRAEARNAEVFRRNFAGNPEVKIPRVFWSYTRRRVLALELLDGIQLADVDVASLSAAELREVYYRYYGVSLADIDPLQVIREAFDLIYSMNLRVPTRFVLLDKAIATLASVGIELYPDFNVFEVAKPYARNLLVERFAPERMLARARKESGDLVRIGAAFPYQVYDFMEQIRDGQIEVGFVHKGLDEFMHKVDVAF